METEKGEAKKKTDKEKIWNLTVDVHDMSQISGTELGKCETSS